MANPRSRYRTIDTELTVDTDAYTANDVVGGLLTLDAHSIGGGLIVDIMLVDEDSAAAPFTLYIFDSKPATIADDAAFAIVIADLRKLIRAVDIAAGDYTTVNSLDYAQKTGLNIPFIAQDGNLYAYLVTTGTPNYTNADALYLRLLVLVE